MATASNETLLANNSKKLALAWRKGQLTQSTFDVNF